MRSSIFPIFFYILHTTTMAATEPSSNKHRQIRSLQQRKHIAAAASCYTTGV